MRSKDVFVRSQISWDGGGAPTSTIGNRFLQKRVENVRPVPVPNDQEVEFGGCRWETSSAVWRDGGSRLLTLDIFTVLQARRHPLVLRLDAQLCRGNGRREHLTHYLTRNLELG